MVIKKISLRGFQAHEKLDLELGDFSAVVGPSSAGKSSILRALMWLLYGEWDKTYPRDQDKETAVAIQLENGTTYIRIRKGAKNTAHIRRPGQKSVCYQDFGDFIPGLLEELNVRPIKVGTARINLNFSNQDDPIFIIHESKPTKAQWLGRLYGAHVINNMLRLMSKDKRTAEAERLAAKDEVRELRDRMKSYDGIEEQISDLDKTKNLVYKLNTMYECRESLKAILRDSEWLRNRKGILKADTDGLKRDITRLGALSGLGADLEEYALHRSSLTRDEGILSVDTKSLRDDASRLALLRETKVAYNEVVATIPSMEAGVRSRSEAVDGLKAMLKEELFKDGRCPICSCKPKKLDVNAMSGRLKSLVGG